VGGERSGSEDNLLLRSKAHDANHPKPLNNISSDTAQLVTANACCSRTPATRAAMRRPTSSAATEPVANGNAIFHSMSAASLLRGAPTPPPELESIVPLLLRIATTSSRRSAAAAASRSINLHLRGSETRFAWPRTAGNRAGTFWSCRFLSTFRPFDAVAMWP
jgi:hypothetical protein